jgi:hypothetical protein
MASTPGSWFRDVRWTTNRGCERLGLDDGDTPWIMAEIDRPGWGELA